MNPVSIIMSFWACLQDFAILLSNKILRQNPDPKVDKHFASNIQYFYSCCMPSSRRFVINIETKIEIWNQVNVPRSAHWLHGGCSVYLQQ